MAFELCCLLDCVGVGLEAKRNGVAATTKRVESHSSHVESHCHFWRSVIATIVNRKGWKPFYCSARLVLNPIVLTARTVYLFIYFFTYFTYA